MLLPEPCITTFCALVSPPVPCENVSPSKVRFPSASKVVPPPLVIILWLPSLFIDTLAGNDSNVGSAPLFARKNLPSLDHVPCGNFVKSTA